MDYAQGTRYLTQDELSQLIGMLGNLETPFTLKLLDDVDFAGNEAYQNRAIGTTGQVTLDLNGHKLTAASWGTTGGSLTVIDTSTAKDGVLQPNRLTIGNGAAVTLNSGTIKPLGSMVDVSGTLTINGGTFNAGSMGVFTTGGLTVNGGTLTGSNLSLTGPSIATLSLDEEDTTAQDTGVTMRITGGTVETSVSVNYGATLAVIGSTAQLKNVTISGGTFETFTVETGTGSRGEVQFSSGTFKSVGYTGSKIPAGLSIADFLTEGYAYTSDSNSGVVVDPTALNTPHFIGTVSYTVKAHTHKYEETAGSLKCACGSTIKNQPVKYIDAYGKTRECTDYTVLNDMEYKGSLDAGWYVVKGQLEIGTSGCVSLEGYVGNTVHIILCDAAELTIANGVKAHLYHDEGADESLPVDLAIYGQENDTGKMTVTGIGNLHLENDGNKAGIAVKNLTINGGTMNVTVKLDKGCTAESDGNALNANNTSSAQFTGGTVTATGGKVTLTNAVAADDAVGSGKGYNATNTGISGMYLTVAGGAVTAKSGGTGCNSRYVPLGDRPAPTYGAISWSVNTSAATVQGGTFLVTSGKTSLSVAAGNSWTDSDAFITGTLTVSGGTLTVHSGGDAAESHRELFADQSAEITGGTVQSDENGGTVFWGTS